MRTIGAPLLIPQDAVLTLAGGRLRSEPGESWRLFQNAWPLLERYVVLRLAGGGLAGDRLGDCAQNAFVRIWAHRRSYRGSSEGEFWKWITRICDNERFRFTRRAARQAQTSESATSAETMTETEESTAPIGQALEHDDACRALRGCLGLLAPLESRVVQLIYFEPCFSERGAAELLDLSPATVHKLKVQALAALGDCLRAKGVEE